jgi:predicted CopG family antitoxin
MAGAILQYTHTAVYACVTKPITLSDQAFVDLRREKRASESDSQTIQRLIREAHARRLKPNEVPWHLLKRDMSPDEHLQMIRDSRDADRGRDPWA